MTRGEARERILAAATALGQRHGREGVRSLRESHNVEYIARLVAAQAGVGPFYRRRTAGPGRIVDEFDVAATYSAAYSAAALVGTP